MTCYIIFLLTYPFLNMLMKELTQKQLLRIIFVMSLLWIIADFVVDSLFFPSALILWCTIYFIVAYIKLFMPDFQNSKQDNIIVLLIGLVGYIGEVVLTNELGIYISFLTDKLLRWNLDCNPFGLLLAIGAFNLFRSMHFKNLMVNYLSSLSMLIYLIHENILFRTYYRPVIWQWIYKTYGYNRILLYTLVYVIMLFIASALLGVVYKESIQRFVSYLSNKIYCVLTRVWLQLENMIILIK